MSILRVGRKLSGESPLANAAEEEIRHANVTKVMGDHREQIDDLLRSLVQRNLGRRQA
jgi:hypothetical protein